MNKLFILIFAVGSTSGWAEVAPHNKLVDGSETHPAANEKTRMANNYMSGSPVLKSFML